MRPFSRQMPTMVKLPAFVGGWVGSVFVASVAVGFDDSWCGFEVLYFVGFIGFNSCLVSSGAVPGSLAPTLASLVVIRLRYGLSVFEFGPSSAL